MQIMSFILGLAFNLVIFMCGRAWERYLGDESELRNTNSGLKAALTELEARLTELNKVETARHVNGRDN